MRFPQFGPLLFLALFSFLFFCIFEDMKKIFLIAVFCSFALPLSACGVKPDSVSAPKTYEGPAYPRAYP